MELSRSELRRAFERIKHNFGPVTELVSAREFVRHAHATLDKAQQRVNELQADIDAAGHAEELEQRCR